MVGSKDFACSNEGDSIVCETAGNRANVVNVMGRYRSEPSFNMICPADVDVQEASYAESSVTKFDTFYSVTNDSRSVREGLKQKGCKDIEIRSNETAVSKDDNFSSISELRKAGVETRERNFRESNI